VKPARNTPFTRWGEAVLFWSSLGRGDEGRGGKRGEKGGGPGCSPRTHQSRTRCTTDLRKAGGKRKKTEEREVVLSSQLSAAELKKKEKNCNDR